jgi:hypothetical protein
MKPRRKRRQHHFRLSASISAMRSFTWSGWAPMADCFSQEDQADWVSKMRSRSISPRSPIRFLGTRPDRRAVSGLDHGGRGVK